MATIAELIKRIETKLYLVSGLDVQIHAEEQLIESLRSVYTQLFDEFWRPQDMKFMTLTLDGVTGNVTADLSTIVSQYEDIISVYLEDRNVAMPHVVVNTPLTNVRQPSIMPSSNSAKVFTVIPVTTTGTVGVWYRTRVTDAMWDSLDYNIELDMDPDLLMSSVIYEFLVNDGSNDQAVKLYVGKTEQRKNSIRKQQWNAGLSKRAPEYNTAMTDWSVI